MAPNSFVMILGSWLASLAGLDPFTKIHDYAPTSQNHEYNVQNKYMITSRTYTLNVLKLGLQSLL